MKIPGRAISTNACMHASIESPVQTLRERRKQADRRADMAIQSASSPGSIMSSDLSCYGVKHSTTTRLCSRAHTRIILLERTNNPINSNSSTCNLPLACLNMSNRIVPAIYKQVIEDVISAVREDFEEYGVDDNLVGYLQQLWEASLVQTRVAKFVDGDDEESEDEQPLRNGAVLPLPHQLSNMSRPGNMYTSEDVKPQIDANGNGTYNGGLRGGADGTVRRLRGGAVGLRFGLGDGCS